MQTTTVKVLKVAGATAIAVMLGIVPLTVGTARAQSKPVYGVLLKTLSNP